jgi:signal transduction histidine kinase
MAHPNVRAHRDSERLAEEQAALRRVAMLVAQGASPSEVFEAVAAEVARLLESDFSLVGRYEADATLTHVASHPLELLSQLGARTVLDGDDLASVVQRSGRPACIDYDDAPGRVAALARELGVRCAVAAPIVVDDRVWGVAAAGWGLPGRASTEAAERAAEFTELVATALANTESRNEIARLAEEQAALHRMATLVARGAQPSEVFAAAIAEVGRVVGADASVLVRYEPGDLVTHVCGWSRTGGWVPVGTVLPLTRGTASWLVWESSRPARIESYAGLSGPHAGVARKLGWRSSVAAPIIVESRLWGVMIVGSTTDRPLPVATEGHLAEFTELVAMAIANAESRAELAASRARIVATADATRQRIERDLHDGAQQQLVSLALELRAAQATLPPELADQRAELSRVVDGLTDVLEGLREIARGIHPAILSEGGLGPALKTLARRSPVPVALDVGVRGRLPDSVEVATYYVVAEMLTNAAKHARASTVQVDVGGAGGILHVSVRDDGVGGADPARGSGLVGLRDRVEALGGTMSVESPKGGGTAVEVALPLDGSRAVADQS